MYFLSRDDRLLLDLLAYLVIARAAKQSRKYPTWIASDTSSQRRTIFSQTQNTLTKLLHLIRVL